jgi:hypothetical protein
MDNGLIFPYPRVGAHDEPSCANHPIPLLPLFRGWWWLGERGNPGGSSRAMG